MLKEDIDNTAIMTAGMDGLTWRRLKRIAIVVFETC